MICKKEEEKAFYVFRQISIGGYFIINDKLDIKVFIEAKSSDEANSIAESIGICFNGVIYDLDYDCFCDRWYQVEESSRDKTTIDEYLKTAKKYDTMFTETLVIHEKGKAPYKIDIKDGVRHG